jgi:predicted RNA-binding Zn-ribbon protein involved in translation (DUF1610 family)
MTNKIPTFYTTIKNGQRSFKCPNCNKKNIHSSDEGHRTSHCPCWSSGYEIKDQDG